MAKGINKQQGCPISNFTLCGNKGQDQGQNGGSAGRGDDTEKKAKKEGPQKTPFSLVGNVLEQEDSSYKSL